MIEGELGEFLRSRREAVRPEAVGLPAGGRRMTPGLRRAELATLAGISVEYLIRLEQGRDTRPSVQVLAALAQTLRLSDADREHLQQLATVSLGTDLCDHARPTAARTVRPTLHAVLDALHPTPAVIINHLTDVLAWNTAYDALTRPSGLLDAHLNLLRHVFTDPRARDTYPDWGAVADEHVAYLHAFHRGDPAATELADSLAADVGDEFTRRWDKRPISSGRTGPHAITHPDVGVLRLTREAMDLADRYYLRLIAYLPADAATAARLDHLVGRHPGALRLAT